MDWGNVKIHLLDFEGSVRTGIVEYGIATVCGGRITGVASRLCSVRRAIPAEESEVHGIFDADVEGLAPIEADWEIFRAFRQSGLMGSHHAPAEIGMIKTVWPSPGTVPDFSFDFAPKTNDWGPWIDTCHIAQTWFPEEQRHSLGYLVERFQIFDRVEKDAKKFCPPRRARFHCALFVAIAAADLLLNMCAHPACERSSFLDVGLASVKKQRLLIDLQGELDLF